MIVQLTSLPTKSEAGVHLMLTIKRDLEILPCHSQLPTSNEALLAAKSGHKDSLDNVRKGLMDRLCVKDEYEQALRGYQNWD